MVSTHFSHGFENSNYLDHHCIVKVQGFIHVLKEVVETSAWVDGLSLRHDLQVSLLNVLINNSVITRLLVEVALTVGQRRHELKSTVSLQLLLYVIELLFRSQGEEVLIL